MRLWWLWAVLLALLAGIWMLRIGVRIALSQGIWTVTLRIGPCSIRLYPPKKEEQPEKVPQEEQPDPDPPSKPKFQLPKWDPGQIRSAVQALWPTCGGPWTGPGEASELRPCGSMWFWGRLRIRRRARGHTASSSVEYGPSCLCWSSC